MPIITLKDGRLRVDRYDAEKTKAAGRSVSVTVGYLHADIDISQLEQQPLWRALTEGERTRLRSRLVELERHRSLEEQTACALGLAEAIRTARVLVTQTKSIPDGLDVDSLRLEFRRLDAALKRAGAPASKRGRPRIVESKDEAAAQPGLDLATPGEH